MAEAEGSGRRTLLRALIAGGLVVGVALAIIAGTSMIRERVDLRPDAEAVLRALGSGQAVDVYDGAAPKLRELMLEERFVEMAETMNKTLGPFEKTVDIIESKLFSGASGRTARVVLRLKFANAETTGDFSFLRVGRGWKLMGMRVSVPEKLEAAVAALEREPSRTRAPKEVIQMVREIGKALEKGDLDTISKMRSLPMRESVSRADLAELVAGKTRALGPVKRMLDVLSSTQSRGKDRAEVSAVFQFENTKATVHFKFVKGQTGQWALLGFKIPHPAASEPE